MEGIRRGLLCPFHYLAVPDEVDYSNIPSGRLSHFLTGPVYVPEGVGIQTMLRRRARR